eukprot:GILJ01002037.1.p1 GENE.GILJ01002037.1~~GILJ01002037.1.p1  ORF type:complete len:616 (+),score=143.05 GILJ01002037.1:162-2009(+)
MRLYKLDNLLQDTLERRGRLTKKPLPLGTHAVTEYREVWDSFNRYLTATFLEKKGINVNVLGKFLWQIEKRTVGQKPVQKLRPLFLLSEFFARNHNIDIKKQTIIADKDCTAVEELNFTKLAIRYSTNLTKDNAFSGLRMIVIQLGEAIAQGRRVLLDFEIGRLEAVEKKVRFHFDLNIYRESGLEPPSTALAMHSDGYQPSVTFQKPSKEALALVLEGLNSASLEENQQQQQYEQQQQQQQESESKVSHRQQQRAPQQHSSSSTTEKTQAQTQAQTQTQREEDGQTERWKFVKEANTERLYLDTDARSDVTHEEKTQELSPAKSVAKSFFDSDGFHLSPTKSSSGKQATRQLAVIDDAFERHMMSLEQKALEAVRESVAAEEILRLQKSEEEAKRSKTIEERRKYADYLKTQMKERKEKVRQAKSQLDAPAVAILGSDGSLAVTDVATDHKGSTLQEKIAAKQDVLEQAREKEEKKRRQREKELQEDRRRVEAIAAEAQKQKQFEAIKNYEAKAALKEAWLRDMRIKDIERRIEHTEQMSPVNLVEEDDGNGAASAFPWEARTRSQEQRARLQSRGSVASKTSAYPAIGGLVLGSSGSGKVSIPKLTLANSSAN